MSIHTMNPLAITMGCPVGIGPEIILKYFAANPTFPFGVSPVVVGDPAVLSWCSQTLSLPCKIVSWEPGDKVEKGVIPVYCPAGCNVADAKALAWGKPDVQTGMAMAHCIESAVEGIIGQIFSGLVTCPITKKALNEDFTKRFPRKFLMAKITAMGILHTVAKAVANPET